VRTREEQRLAHMLARIMVEIRSTDRAVEEEAYQHRIPTTFMCFPVALHPSACVLWLQSRGLHQAIGKVPWYHVSRVWHLGSTARTDVSLLLSSPDRRSRRVVFMNSNSAAQHRHLPASVRPPFSLSTKCEPLCLSTARSGLTAANRIRTNCRRPTSSPKEGDCFILLCVLPLRDQPSPICFSNLCMIGIPTTTTTTTTCALRVG
jgi:hypothetical protein